MATTDVEANLFPSRAPQLNHVAMSMPAEALSAEGRDDILRFYGEVFGWTEVPMMTEDRKCLVMTANTFEQFIFLIADDEPMATPRMDHFGLSVGDIAELQGVHARASAYRERDSRVDVIDPAVEDHEVIKIHNTYVGYLLPLMIEVQYWEFVDR